MERRNKKNTRNKKRKEEKFKVPKPKINK